MREVFDRPHGLRDCSRILLIRFKLDQSPYRAVDRVDDRSPLALRLIEELVPSGSFVYRLGHANPPEDHVEHRRRKRDGETLHGLVCLGEEPDGPNRESLSGGVESALLSRNPVELLELAQVGERLLVVTPGKYDCYPAEPRDAHSLVLL